MKIIKSQIDNQNGDNALLSTAETMHNESEVESSESLLENNVLAVVAKEIDGNAKNIKNFSEDEKIETNTAQSQISNQKLQEHQTQKFGKFQNANALYSAYKSLESEFTKRNQENSNLKKSTLELEETIDKLTVKLNNILDDEEFIAKATLTPSISEQVIKSYLNSKASENVTVIPVLTSKMGQAVVARTTKPKTLEEAKVLATVLLGRG
ncbi:MAG: hypothetical protein FWE13_02340 [Firmicutes bacterium]|nr:hypothetical protein [Bacillota bacterium]